MPSARAGLISKYAIWIVLACVGRLYPHLPNATPLMALSVMAGLSADPLVRKHALLLTLSSLIVSDILLGLLHHFPIIGGWTVFTYSGFLLITYTAHHFQKSFQDYFSKQCALVLSASLFYWLWTNFGVWLLGYYSYSAQGFLTCYSMALPFLPQSLLGDLSWFIVLRLLLQFAEYCYAKFQVHHLG